MTPNRDDIIRMAAEVWNTGSFYPIPSSDDIERFAELVRADTRNATLDEIAKKIEAMPFGDTAASFAVWIREQKT